MELYKHHWKAAFWIIFSIVLMPLLVLPVGIGQDIITSRIVSKYEGKDVFCFIARNNPKSGCYIVDQKVTWSNYYFVKEVIYTNDRDPHATDVTRKGDTIIGLVLILTFIIILIWDKYLKKLIGKK